MKKLVALLVVVVLALGAWTAAGPFLTIRALRTAIDEQDSAALSTYVDFPSVRASIRAQVEDYLARRTGAQAQDGVLGALSMGVASAAAGGLTDLLATPAGIGAVMQGRSVFRRLRGDAPTASSPEVAAAANPLRDVQYGFESLSRFTATVRNADGAPVVLVLTRRGMRWVVTDVRLPLAALDPTL